MVAALMGLFEMSIMGLSDGQKIVDIAKKVKNNYIKCDELGENGLKRFLCAFDPTRDLNKELEIKKKMEIKQKSLNYLSYV